MAPLFCKHVQTPHTGPVQARLTSEIKLVAVYRLVTWLAGSRHSNKCAEVCVVKDLVAGMAGAAGQ